jgi:glycosyltransferase involved in cell wall biosynthesis
LRHFFPVGSDPHRVDAPDEGASTIEVVVCVPTFRRPDMLRDTLLSLGAQQEAPAFAVVVIDNDAAQCDGAVVASGFFQTGALNGRVALEARQGNCHAINAAFALALRSYPHAEFFLMIDDDEIADPHWLRRMIDAAKSQNADIVGGPVLPRFARAAAESVTRHPVFWPAFATSGAKPMIYGSGNCLLRRRVFDALSSPRLDVAFNFLGGGDTEFFTRCREAHMRFYWENDARIFETVPTQRMSAGWIFRRGLRIGAINRRIDAQRYGGALIGRLRLAAKDVAVAGRAALRALAGVAKGDPALIAAHPLVIALGRFSSAFGVETEQYRAPTTTAPNRALLLISPSATPCGVETFARRLAEGRRAQSQPAQILAVSGRAHDLPALWRALRDADSLVLNFPVVAWKKMLLTPLVALIAARLLNRNSLVMFHEWDDLDWRRRLIYLAYAFAARRIAFSSPMVRAQFLRHPLRAAFAGGTAILPIPSNMAPAATTHENSSHVARLRLERAKGKRILGHFGSIYPKKQSDFALRVAAELKARGDDVFLVFIGDFIRGFDTVEADFNALLRELDLANDTYVTGYVVDSGEIFAIFDEVDSFVYRFAEGLSSRRGSVLACLQAGRRVIANAPQDADEFAHHRQYRGALAGGALCCLPRDATAGDYADALLAPQDAPLSPDAKFYALGWRDAALALDAALNARQAQEAVTPR